MPIVTCLKKIKDQLMTRFYSKNLESEEMCGQICPKIRKKLDKNINMSNNCTALPAGQHIFHVKGMVGEYDVNIQKEECSCRAWQLSGIPCRHGVACLRHERIKPEDVVNKCYSIDAFRAAYGKIIMPCSDPRVWPKTNGPQMLPPNYEKKVGRPGKKRKNNPLEEDNGTRMSRHGIIGHCSVCNQPGHNKRKCPELGRGQPTAAHEAGAEQDPAAEQYPAAEEEAAEHVQTTEHVPIQVVLPETQQRTKLPVKRRPSCKVHFP